MRPRRRTILALVLVAVLLALWAWLRHRDHFHAVIPGEVYRSAQLTGEEFRQRIEAEGLQTILSLRPAEPEAQWYREEIAAAEETGIEHLTVGLLQSAPSYDRVLDLLEALKSAERPLLMHCLSGVDRSGLGGLMTLLLESGAGLEEAAAQVGWRYNAIRPESVGKPFLAQYREWLAANGAEHDPATFERWLREDYADPTGNIHFLVHPIGGEYWLKPFGEYDEGKRFTVSRTESASLELDGWAYDSKARAPLVGVEVFLDGEPFADSEYGQPTPWLEGQFSAEGETRIGWAASQPMEAIGDGCHDLSFEFTRRDDSRWRSPPAGRICIE